MGSPPAHIRSLHAGGDMLHGRGEETAPMVKLDGSGCPIEGHVKRYFGRRMGAEVTVIREVWR